MTDHPNARVTRDRVVHAVVSTGYKSPAGCGPEELLLNFACDGWEYAFDCDPAPVVTCPDCKEAQRG